MPFIVFIALMLSTGLASAASYDGLSPKLTVDDRGSAAEHRSLDAVFAAGLKSLTFWRSAQELANVPGSIRVSFADTGARDAAPQPADPGSERIGVSGAWGRTKFSDHAAHVMLSEALVGRHPGRIATTLAHELFGHAVPGLKTRARGLGAYNDLDVDELYARLLEAVVGAEIGGDAQYWDDCRTGGPAERVRQELIFESPSYAYLLSPAQSSEPGKAYQDRLVEARKRLAQSRRELGAARRLLRKAEELERSSPATANEDRDALAFLRFSANGRLPASIVVLKAVIQGLDRRVRVVGTGDWREWRSAVAKAGASTFVAEQESAVARLSDRCRQLQPGAAPERLAEATARLRKRIAR